MAQTSDTERCRHNWATLNSNRSRTTRRCWTTACPPGLEISHLHAVGARRPLVRLHPFSGGGEVLGVEDIDQCVSTGARCLRLCPISYAHGALRRFGLIPPTSGSAVSLRFGIRCRVGSRKGAQLGSPMLVWSFPDRAGGLPSLCGRIPAPRFTSTHKSELPTHRRCAVECRGGCAIVHHVQSEAHNASKLIVAGLIQEDISVWPLMDHESLNTIRPSLDTKVCHTSLFQADAG